MNENVAGLVARLNPDAANGAGKLLQPGPPAPGSRPGVSGLDRAADVGSPLRSAGAGAVLPLVPSGADTSSAAAREAAARGRDPTLNPGMNPSPGSAAAAEAALSALAAPSLDPAKNPSLAARINSAGEAPAQGRALRRVASSAAAARRRRGFDPDFDRAALFLNPLRYGGPLACSLRASCYACETGWAARL